MVLDGPHHGPVDCDQRMVVRFYGTIQDTALLWFFLNMMAWFIFWGLFKNSVTSDHYIKQGLTTVRLRFDRKIFLHKFRDFMMKKQVTTYEERNYGILLIT